MTSLHLEPAEGTTLSLMRGDAAFFDVVVEKNEARFDFSQAGVQAWFTLKTSPSLADAAKTLQKTLGSGITAVSPTQGKIRVALTGAETAALDPRVRYFWDLQIYDPAAGEPFTPLGLWGRVTVLADITRATS